MLQCNICKTQFTSDYLLLKHQNRKIPCNVIFECIRCKRILSSDTALENHYNKKTPCVESPKFIKPIKKPTNNKNDVKNKIIILEKKKEISLEIQRTKEKLKEQDRKFKLEIQKEKARKKEQDRKFKLEIQKEKAILLERKEAEKKCKEKQRKRELQDQRDIIEMEIQREYIIQCEKEERKMQMIAAKTKQIELQKQIQQEKLYQRGKMKDLEYSRSDKRSRDYTTYIKMYADNIDRKKAAALEIIKAKTDAMKTIEVMKNERKEQTPQIINNNITINNINLCINHITEKYMDKAVIDVSQMQNNANDYFSYNMKGISDYHGIQFLNGIFQSSDCVTSIIKHILELAYNNKDKPNQRCVFYVKELDNYFGIFTSDGAKEVKLMDFERDLFPRFKQQLAKIAVAVSSNVEKYLDIRPTFDESQATDNFMKFKQLKYYQQEILPFKSCLKNIKELSDSVFEIECPTSLPIIV